jgi:hypothetical protein
MPQIVSIFTSFSRRTLMSSLPVTSQMSLTLEFLEASAMFFKSDQNIINLLLKFMKDSCLAMTQTHVHIVFQQGEGCVETTCDTVFDETNGSQVKQYDLDVVDDEKAPCEALQRMATRDVRPQSPSEPQASQPSNDTTPPTQGHEQDQEDEQDEDEAHDQEESIDQGGDKDDGDHQVSR